ncbi:MAG: hypothetical protein H7A47_10750 [Verrucomicrobiales bacterium]|nr:hypothetical protein [Verrucomicrobiales bacterium]
MHADSPKRTPVWHALAAGALLVALGLGVGCGLVRRAADAPGQAVRLVTAPGSKATPMLGPAEVDASLMRFADFYLLKLGEATSPTAVETADRGDCTALWQWRLRRAHAVLSLASAPNPYVNLFDFAVFVSLDRLALEGEPPVGISAEQAARLGAVFRDLEAEIWRIARRVGDAATVDSFRQSIEEWRRNQGEAEESAHGLARQLADWYLEQQIRTDNKPANLLAVLSLDPLAGLDPATRELAETRRLAERALFIARTLPAIAAWEIQLVSTRFVQLPESRQAMDDWSTLSEAAANLAETAARLPAELRGEREAILSELDRQSTALKALAAETGRTLDSGRTMADSLDRTLTTFDALMARFGVGEPKTTDPGPPGRPFDITEYGATAERIAEMSRELTRTLENLHATLASPALDRQRQELDRMADRLEVRARTLMREAALLAAGLIVLAGAVGLGVRRLARR